jgi:parvulin-like peptidyl-prolyl isomerase
VAATEPLLELGNSQQAKDEIFHLRQGELSLPIHTDRGYVVLALKDTVPAHQASVQEVRDKVIEALKQQKSAQLAQTKAEELEKRVKAGEKFNAAAKALGLDPKTSDAFARSGTAAGLGSGKQLSAAFGLKVGDVGAPVAIGQNWTVYHVAEKTEPNPDDFQKQEKTLTDNLLQQKRALAFDAFRSALEERLKKDGTLKLYPDKLRGFGSLG